MNGVALLAPWGLVLGVGVAGGLVLLHAISVGRPRPAWLPTARFALDRAPRAERRLARPADRWLLALRVLAALLAGAALARPVRARVRRHVARLVLADVSDAARRGAVRDSVRAVLGPGDALIAFAAVPRPALLIPVRRKSTAADSAVLRATLDSALGEAALGVAPAVPAPNVIGERRPSLSAALVAARRAAPSLAAGADSLELVIVSPFSRDVVDAGTAAVRGTWAGRARLVRVAQAAAPARAAGTPAPRVRPRIALRGGPGDDALAATLALAGVGQDDAAPVRVTRVAPRAADRAWATDSGHVLVVWPADLEADRRGHVATSAEALAIDGRVAGAQVAVGAFGRITIGEDGGVEPESRTAARWADGTPAAVERRTGSGCVRTVGVRVPQTGDAALRPGFIALLPALLGPCGEPRELAPLSAADLAQLAGSGPLLAAQPLRASRTIQDRDPFGATLLALAAALLLIELPLRRVLQRPAQVGGDVDGSVDAMPGAADEPLRRTARPAAA